MLRVRPVTALLFATLCASASQLSAQRGQSYRDPNGRFSLTVPDDWNTISQNGSVIFTSGSTSFSLLPFQGAQSPDQIVSILSQQSGQQWRNLQQINRGEFRVGGVPAYYAMFNGVSPRGNPSMLRIVGFMRGNEEYAFIISSPTNEFDQAKGYLQAMEMSFAFAGGGRGNTDEPQFPQQPRQQPQQQPQFPQQPRQYPQQPQQQPQFPQQPPQQDPQQPRNQPQFPQQQPQFPQQQPQFPQQQPPMASSSGKASMGVALRDLDKDDQNQLGFKDTNGAIVAQVQVGSAAEQAGIVQGDVIVNADQKPINSATDLVKLISGHRMGDTMEITVIRQGRPQVLRVQFGGGRSRPVIPTG